MTTRLPDPLRYLFLAVTLVLVACDIPTSAPIIEQTWVVPIPEDSVTIEDVLPSGVTLSGGELVVSASGSTVGTTLGALCSACAALDGTVAPKPAFAGTVSADVDLPAGVSRITLGTGGQVRLRLTNNLGFDPIRPSASARGRLVVTVFSGVTMVAADTILGQTQALPSGGFLERTLALAESAVVGSPVTASVLVDSPAGDPLLVDSDAPFSVTITPVRVSAVLAEVVVDDEPISASGTTLSLDEVDQDVRRRIQGATVELRVENPLTVGGPLTLRFRVSGADVIPAKSLTLAPGTTAPTVVLTAAEIDALLAATGVSVELDGRVTGTEPGRIATVTPALVVRVSPRVFLNLRVGD